MLADNGIRESDFNPGRLTDHYNPSDKTVNLSEAVYNQRMPQLLLLCLTNGHAVQHAWLVTMAYDAF
jgi:Zn-dependent membrane protease YugP